MPRERPNESSSSSGINIRECQTKAVVTLNDVVDILKLHGVEASKISKEVILERANYLDVRGPSSHGDSKPDSDGFSQIALRMEEKEQHSATWIAQNALAHHAISSVIHKAEEPYKPYVLLDVRPNHVQQDNSVPKVPARPVRINSAPEDYLSLALSSHMNYQTPVFQGLNTPPLHSLPHKEGLQNPLNSPTYVLPESSSSCKRHMTAISPNEKELPDSRKYFRTIRQPAGSQGSNVMAIECVQAFAPNITLIPSPPTIARPPQMRRSQSSRTPLTNEIKSCAGCGRGEPEVNLQFYPRSSFASPRPDVSPAVAKQSVDKQQIIDTELKSSEDKDTRVAEGSDS